MSIIRDYAESIASDFRGNWLKFSSFSWHESPEDSENWGHWNIDSRDSSLLEKSNAAQIREALVLFLSEDGPDCFDEQHNHWAVGYIGVITCRVYQKDNSKEFTPAFLAICELMVSLENYPVLSEEDYSEREQEALLKNISSEGRPSTDWPDDWTNKVANWLSDNNQRTIDNNDGQGGYPSKDEIDTAARALGWHIDVEGLELSPGYIVEVEPLIEWQAIHYQLLDRELIGQWVISNCNVVIRENVNAEDDDTSIIEVEDIEGNIREIYGFQIVELIRTFIKDSRQLKLNY